MSNKPPYSQSLELQNARDRVKELELALNEIKETSVSGLAHQSLFDQLTASRELNQKLVEALEQCECHCSVSEDTRDECIRCKILAFARSQGFGKEKV